MSKLTRREALLTTGSFVISKGLTVTRDPQPRDKARRSLRMAHLTDIHVQPERAAGQGLKKCLDHVMSQRDKPDFIMTGGDLIMDCFGASDKRTQDQWDVFTGVFDDFTNLPVEHCLGNHDVWGWNKSSSGTTGAEPGYGKARALDILGLEKPYRRFKRGKWNFIVLDSVYPYGTSGYTAKLDDKQTEWLKLTLESIPSTERVLVVSHIPILAVSVFFDGDLMKENTWQVPGAWMHTDAVALKDLFLQHPAVKGAISGHIHLVDRCEYNNVSYLCLGAVCGGWWASDYHECKPGYSLVDLYDDGSIESQYVLYDWKYQD